MHRKIDVYRRALAGDFAGHDEWLARPGRRVERRGFGIYIRRAGGWLAALPHRSQPLFIFALLAC